MRRILFTSLCVCLLSCEQKSNDGETVLVGKGIKIPIAACVEANSKILGKSVDPVLFCKCFIPKFYEDLKNDPAKVKSLRDGDWYDLARDKQEMVAKYFKNCMEQTTTNDTTVKFTITPRMATGMKKKMKEELAGSEIEQTQDVDKYCDCIINSLQNDFTIKEVMQENFNETDIFKKAQEDCLKSTKKE